eukprot:6139081-Amphidinium_carterae.1
MPARWSEANAITCVIDLLDADEHLIVQLCPGVEIPSLGFALSELSATDKAAASEVILALAVSVLCYVWMGFCTPTVLVKSSNIQFEGQLPPPSGLSEEQLTFWRLVFLQSLREHFFVNGIASFDGKGTLDDLKIISDNPQARIDTPLQSASASRQRSGALVPMGAGKDSNTSLWLLPKQN